MNYTHSTAEVLQLIKFLKNEQTFPTPYNILCFRSAIVEKLNTDYNEKLNKMFLDTELFIVEICSRKKYNHNGYYLHHLCVDKRHKEFTVATPKDILEKVVIEKQSDEEIEKDLLEIQKLLYPRKMLVVSHYNSKKDG